MILVQPGILTSHSLIDSCQSLGSRFAIISDETVASLYGFSLLERFQNRGLFTRLFTFASKEKSKTREVKQQLEDALLKEAYGSDSCIIALGGGVVSDLSGFLASTFCRGVSLVLIPTTLLSMVDASIGGKNGVNACGIKNIIGTIYEPHRTFIDPDLIKEMPLSLIKEGRIEMIKHALIADRELFFQLEDHWQKTIERNIAIKQEMIRKKSRALLNFGHTVGHAIEAESEYTVTHGDAVLIGIIVESYLSYQMGLLPEEDFKRIERLFEPISFSLDPIAILEKMRCDKKNKQGFIHCVLLQSIGTAFGSTAQAVDEDLMMRSLEYVGRLFEKISESR